MSMAEKPLRLTVGGAVNPRTSVYIVRPSDDELLELLERGEYCNVLCSRQMGKTSLLKRTRARLVERGYATAEIEVAGLLGSPKDADEWYQGLLDEIARQLRLPVNVPEWWQTTTAVTANQKLIRFFREEVIARIPGDKPVIIFLDEIDSTLKLPYTDDFFVAIRAMYNDRASDPVNERIAFCLVGVATPNELIKERRTTPYNIGRTIELQDFAPDRDDLGPIYRSLCDDEAKGEATAREVIRETGGHPYLTLRVCDALAARPCPSPEQVRDVVGQTFGSLDSLKSDVHFDQMLRFINDRVGDKLTALSIYRSILSGEEKLDQSLPPYIDLKLAGLVKCSRNGSLEVRNAIYKRLFNDEWTRVTLEADTKAQIQVRGWRKAAEINVNILGAELDNYDIAFSQYQSLTANPTFKKENADELWGQFLDKRAVQAQKRRDLGAAILWQIKALIASQSIERQRSVNALIAEINASIAKQSSDQLFAQTGQTMAVSFSLDGRKLLIGCNDYSAYILSSDSGKVLTPPLQHEDTVIAVAFSSNGQQALTGGEDNMARIWDTISGKPLTPPLRHDDWVTSVDFSPDGCLALTGSDDNLVRLWSTATGQLHLPLLQHDSFVKAVAFSPDGHMIASGTSEHATYLWNASTGQIITKLLGHDATVTSVIFRSDGKILLTGSRDNTARLWDTRTGTPLAKPLLHDSIIKSLAFSPNGRMVLTATADRIYASRLDENELQVFTSQPLPGKMIWNARHYFLDSDAKHLKVALSVANNSLSIIIVNLEDIPIADPLLCNPNALLREWQERLRLKISDAGEIVPL